MDLCVAACVEVDVDAFMGVCGGEWGLLASDLFLGPQSVLLPFSSTKTDKSLMNTAFSEGRGS